MCVCHTAKSGLLLHVFAFVVVVFFKEAWNVVKAPSENANVFSDAYEIVAKRILF